MLSAWGALRGGMPLYKFAGNRVLTWIQNKLLRARLSEFHSGYRIYSTKALAAIPFDRNSKDFHFDTEIIIQLVIAGLPIRELPIPTYYGDEICHVNGVFYAMHCAWEALKHAGLHRWSAPRLNHTPNDAPNARNSRDNRGPAAHTLSDPQRPQEQPPANLKAGARAAT